MLGLIVLAVVSSLAREQVCILELLATAAVAIGFTLLIAKWGTRTVRVIAPRLAAVLQAGDVQFHLAMVLLFALSVAAANAGIAAIVGAFLAGLSLADTAGERVRNMTNGVAELLVPFFLAGIGLRLDLSVFSSLRTISLALVILAAAVAWGRFNWGGRTCCASAWGWCREAKSAWWWPSLG